VCEHHDLARALPVLCYPRRWDSVSFYLEHAVACFGADEQSQLIAAIENTDTLLFVKNGQSFTDLLAALPAHLEFVPRGLQGWNVRVGIVQPKNRRPLP
jgi:hypothetical protein